MIEYIDKSIKGCFKQAMKKLKSYSSLVEKDSFKKFYNETPIYIYDKPFEMKGNSFYVDTTIYINKDLNQKEKEFYILKAFIEMYFENINKNKLTKIELKALSNEYLGYMYPKKKVQNIDIKDIFSYARIFHDGFNMFPLEIYTNGNRLGCDDGRSFDEVIEILEDFIYNLENDLFIEASEDLTRAQRKIQEINIEKLTSMELFNYVYTINKIRNTVMDDDLFVYDYIKEANKKFIKKNIPSARGANQKLFEEKLIEMEKFAQRLAEYSKTSTNEVEVNKLSDTLLNMINSFELYYDRNKVEKSKKR